VARLLYGLYLATLPSQPLSTLPFQALTDRLLVDPIKIRFDKLGRAARYASAGLVVGARIHL
jgi:hypothetical protein